MNAGEFWVEVRRTARTLRRSPAFTLAAVGVLALGLGVNTALFSAIRATLLVDPPFPEHERLVVLELTDSSTVRPGPPRSFPWSYPKFGLIRESELPLDVVAAFAGRRLTLTGAGDAAYLGAEIVTPGYLELLATAPGAGRFFRDGDGDLLGSRGVVLGHALWRDRYGGDPAVVGRPVELDGHPVEVVGIAPPGFGGLTGDAELWLTVGTAGDVGIARFAGEPDSHWLQVVGRLAPGTDLAVLDERMHEAGRAIDETWPAGDPTVVRGGKAISLAQATVNPQARTTLLVLGGGALLLLVVTCINLAALLLARASDRGKEAAVRVALGAGRWRVARSSLLEALLLAAGGGLVGVVVGRMTLEGLAAIWPARFLRAGMGFRAAPVDAAGLDVWVLSFAVCAALVTGALCGLLPSLRTAGADPAERLRGGAETGGPPGRWDAGRTLVAGEVAVALMLLVGAGLLVRSLSELRGVERGFDPQGLVAFSYGLGRAGVEDPTDFHERYLERLRSVPGVEAAAATCVVPLSGHCMITRARAAGSHVWSEGDGPAVGVNFVSDDFFRALAVPVLQGRTFTAGDQRDTKPVVVLSERAARELFPEGSPVGQTISLGLTLTPEDGPGAEVVGVVGDVLFDRPANGVMAEAFVSHRQMAGSGTVLLRVRGDPLSAISGARSALAELDANVPIFRVRTMEELEMGAANDTRVLGLLLSAFAGLALLLACTGVWGLMAYAVARRTREIGVRVAMGAQPPQVVRSVLRRGLVTTLVGAGVGAAAAWAGAGVLRSVLFGVEAADPWTFAAAVTLLLSVAALAAWLPARRAASVDPMAVLRGE